MFAILYVTCYLLLLAPLHTNAGKDELSVLLAKMESDVIELAKEVETVYKTRCTSAFQGCSQSNYDSCVSEFSNSTCHKSDEFINPNCSTSTDGKCASLISYTESTVVLPTAIANGTDSNPTDPQVSLTPSQGKTRCPSQWLIILDSFLLYPSILVQVIESVCYSRSLEDYFIKKRNNDAGYWSSLVIESPTMFFGSQEGMFRIFPGRQWEKCGSFDPRLRPWYIAASSGPKNIILVLNTSGSMNGQRLELLKKAAILVIETLTVGDRVAIVPFASTSYGVIGDSDGRMLAATKENRDYLVNAINGLKAIGGTNLYDALQSAFDTLDKTVAAELHVTCNSAILFLTDGLMENPQGVNVTGQNVIDLVSSRINATMTSMGKPILFFTYSISSDDEMNTFPKELACSTEFGVWSKISEPKNIIQSLTSYYRLFSLGLGNSKDNFTVWVDPYSFATGGVNGSTVSAPVYDRSLSPPLLLGVVGINFPLSAAYKALGIDDPTALDQTVLASTAKCPTLNLTLCVLESFRKLSVAGNESLCFAGNCSGDDFVQVEPIKCESVSDHPSNLWANTNVNGKNSYAVRIKI